MSTKHTPGPWKQGENPMDIIASAGGQWDIATVAENCGANDDENTPPDCDGESLANARLIAVAPELLAAAKKHEEADDFHANCPECGDSERIPELCGKCFPLYDDARLMRRAAIAKAEGQS